jgi:hypothetical protein
MYSLNKRNGIPKTQIASLYYIQRTKQNKTKQNRIQYNTKQHIIKNAEKKEKIQRVEE